MVLAVVCVTAGNASAGAAPWRTLVDPAGGFSIAVPVSWQVVPRSTPELNALIARLAKTKRTALANQLRAIAAVRRVTHTVYRFQAFSWPPPKGAVVPDVTVKADPLTAGTTSTALPRIAQAIAKAISRSPTATVSAPVRRTLPAGQAFEVTGTTKVSKTLRSRYAIYLLIHGNRLYSISFRGPATTVESRIVNRFRFS
jgi:hypothetical protein